MSQLNNSKPNNPQPKKWTSANITDQSNKTFLITGANCGLGYQTAKALAGKGAQVIMACRNVEKGENARAKIIKQHAQAKVEVLPLDLANLDSVRAFSLSVMSQYKQLDVLINNAGVMMSPFFQTQQGFEGQIGTNHFGHFALTALLAPLLKKSPSPRIVNVASSAHKRAKLDFDNLNYEDQSAYTPAMAYSNSKLANLLFTYELHRKFAEHSIDILVVAAHPGLAMTDLIRHFEKNIILKISKPIWRILLNNPKAGAWSQLFAATNETVAAGEYYGPSGLGEYRGYPVKVKSTLQARNEESAQKLWKISEKLCGIVYPLKKLAK